MKVVLKSRADGAGVAIFALDFFRQAGLLPFDQKTLLALPIPAPLQQILQCPDLHWRKKPQHDIFL